VPPPVAVPPVVVRLTVRSDARPIVPVPSALIVSVVPIFCVPALSDPVLVLTVKPIVAVSLSVIVSVWVVVPPTLTCVPMFCTMLNPNSAVCEPSTRRSSMSVTAAFCVATDVA
jgi:hypothetical protein